MFTPDFSRLRLALSVVSVLAGTWVLVLAGLQLLARTAESSGDVYPYRQEDWLRYLLPALWAADRQPLVLLAGPSTTRENLLAGEFEAAYPGHRVFQGGMSTATLADVIASLAYVERAYGREALPEVIVLGVSPRVLAELPVERPFATALDQYSRRYRVQEGARVGFELERKPLLSGLAAEARFLMQKQATRYRTALAWLAAQAVGPEASRRLWQSAPMRALLDSGLGWRLMPQRLLELGIHGYAREQISVHKYVGGFRIRPAGLQKMVDNPESYWTYLRTWDLAGDSLEMTARAQALVAYARAHRIDTYVVNLPMRSIGRVHAAPDFDSRFRNFLEVAFAPLPVLDLRAFLSDAEFRDVEHAFPAGARRVSHEVIAFMAEVSEARGAPIAARPAKPRLVTGRPGWRTLAETD